MYSILTEYTYIPLHIKCVYKNQRAVRVKPKVTASYAVSSHSACQPARVQR